MPCKHEMTIRFRHWALMTYRIMAIHATLTRRIGVRLSIRQPLRVSSIGRTRRFERRCWRFESVTLNQIAI